LANSGPLLLFDASSGAEAELPLEALAGAGTVAFCPDRRTLVASTEAGVQFWNVVTRQQVGPQIETYINGLSLGIGTYFAVPSPDGAFVLAGTNDRGDRTARLWDRPPGFEAKPADVTLAVEVLTGMSLGSDGRIRKLDDSDWTERRRRLEPLLDVSPGLKRLVATAESRDRHRELVADYRATGNGFAMIWHLDRLIADEPMDSSLRALRGDARRSLGLFEAALDDYARAAELDPGRASCWQSRAFVLSELKRFVPATEAASRAIELAPGESDHWSERAYAYRQLREYEKAAADYSKAIALDGSRITAYINRGDCVASLGKLAEALKDFEEVVVARERDFWNESLLERGLIRQRLALLQIATGDRRGYRRVAEQAYETLELTAPIQDDDAASHAWVCVYAPGALDDPGRFARLIVGEDPRPGWYLRLSRDGPFAGLIGAALYRAGRYDDAAKVLKQAVKRPEEAGSVAFFFMAMTLQKLGQSEEAMATLAKVIEWTEANGKTIEDGWSWSRKLEFRLIRKEAESLIRRAP
jgi:tetratricopeptide (TPR) repeat protein